MAKDEIQDFFDELKKHDSKKAVPDFKELMPQQNKKRPIWRGITAAATVLILITVGIVLNREEESEPNFTFGNEDKYPTQVLLDEEETLMSWDTSTDYLLEY